MQSIITKFISPSNHRGSRIAARSTTGIRKIYPYNNKLKPEANHASAALSLVKFLDWEGELIGGDIADSEKAWVFTDKGNPIIRTK
jgi:hypothetical protein